MSKKTTKHSEKKPTSKRGTAATRHILPGISREDNSKMLPLLIVFAFVIIAYFPTFFNGFVNWDDDLQVTDNPDITGLSLLHILKIFSSYYAGMYQPLTTLCFAVIYKLFALNAGAYHTFSLLLHMVNIFLVFRLVSKFTDKKDVVFAVTALFAISPVQTATVAWVSATSTLMYSLFFLAALNVYIDYIRAEERKPRKYFLTLLFFLMAILSKSAAVTLPLVLLLCDYFFNSRVSKKDLFNKIPFFIISIAFGILTIISRNDAVHFFNLTQVYGYFNRILFIAFALSFYITSVFAPLKMSAFHAYPEQNGDILPLIFYVAPFFILAIIVFLFLVKKHRKELVFGTLFFLFSISIMIELIPVGTDIVKERYTYLPCVGLYFAFFSFLYGSIKKNESKKYLSYFVVFVSVLFIVLSIIRIRTWKDSFTMWNDVLSKYSDCPEAHNNRGVIFVERGLYDNALRDFNKAIEIRQYYPDAYYNRGLTYDKQGLYDKAIPEYSKAVQINNKYLDAYYNRGVLYGKLGLFRQAISDYTSVIALNPAHAEAYNNRGIVYSNMGLFEKAINDFNKAMAYQPDYSDAYYNRGIAYGSQGLYDKAISDFSKAIELKPDFSDAIYNRDVAMQLQKQNNISGNDTIK